MELAPHIQVDTPPTPVSYRGARFGLAEGECLLCEVLSDVEAGRRELKRIERVRAHHQALTRKARTAGAAPPEAPDLTPRVAPREGLAPVVATVLQLCVELEQEDFGLKSTERRRSIGRRLAAHPELGLTVKAVEDCHHYHRTAVLGTGRSVPALVREYAANLQPREFAVLHIAARMSAVSVSQTQRLMDVVAKNTDFKGPSAEGCEARSYSASKLLSRLVGQGLLDGLPLAFTPGARGPGQPRDTRKGWVITARGIDVYTRVRGDDELHNFQVRPLSDPRAGVGSRAIRHDLGVGDILCSLLGSAGSVELDVAGSTRSMRVNISPENWWGASFLNVGYTAPTRVEGERGVVGVRRPIAPDGFCVVGVRGPVENAALPLLVEYDTASRNQHEVVEQLQAHAELARSGALTERFPDLAGVPGNPTEDGVRPLWVPVLFATTGQGASDGEQRARNIAARVAESPARYWQPGTTAAQPPQYIATHAQIRELGVMAPVLSGHALERGEWPLLRALLTDYRYWLDGALPTYDAVLRLDRLGALIARNAGSAQPQRRGDAERERAATDAKHEELAALREQAREREAERQAALREPAPWDVSPDA